MINIFYSMKSKKGYKYNKEQTSINLDFYKDRKYLGFPDALRRTNKFLQQKQFTMKFSETNMMRYIQRLGNKDVSLVDSMIPLGSCTMKLSSAVCMIPITQANWAAVHPFAPLDQTQGYLQMF